MRYAVTALAAASTLALVAGTSAQEVDVLRQEAIDLTEWTYADLYEGRSWMATDLIGAEVRGVDGETIGDVENVIVGTDGSVDAIMAEIGGFLDIGDTHVRVPWSRASVDFGGEEPVVDVPIDAENVDEFNVFGGTGGEFRLYDDGQSVPQRAWRVTELIDDYVVLGDGNRYGWVEDVVFDTSGEVKAVVVDAVSGPGAYRPYAYPFYGYGYGYRPGRNYYAMPYDAGDLTSLPPVDLEQITPNDQQS